MKNQKPKLRLVSSQQSPEGSHEIETDLEALLSLFQERYSEAKMLMRQFEIELLLIREKGAPRKTIEDLSLKMEALAQREKTWIHKLRKSLDAQKKIIKKLS